MKLYKKIILSILLLLFADQAIAQNINKSSEQRVIYEQKMSYDDARQMRATVEQIEKQKQGQEMDPDQVSPIIGAMKNDSDQNSKMLDMLKTLLNAMGIDNLPENPDEQQGLEDGAKSDKRGESNFKTWEDRHNWKGIRSEQR